MLQSLSEVKGYCTPATLEVCGYLGPSKVQNTCLSLSLTLWPIIWSSLIHIHTKECNISRMSSATQRSVCMCTFSPESIHYATTSNNAKSKEQGTRGGQLDRNVINPFRALRQWSGGFRRGVLTGMYRQCMGPSFRSSPVFIQNQVRSITGRSLHTLISFSKTPRMKVGMNDNQFYMLRNNNCDQISSLTTTRLVWLSVTLVRHSRRTKILGDPMIQYFLITVKYVELAQAFVIYK